MQWQQQNGDSICTKGGKLPCRLIYFILCPQLSHDADKWVFRNVVAEAIRMVINNHRISIRSIAFPAIGCGRYRCNPNFVAQTLISAVAYELQQHPSLQLNVSFVILQERQDVFDAFRRQLLAFKNNRPIVRPARAITPAEPSPLRVPNVVAVKRPFVFEKRLLDQSSSEFNTVVREFTATMTRKLFKKIVCIELVWNECWYEQYQIHKKAFRHRLRSNTEQLLFHGCPEDSANNIMKKCFNRSYAGKNGKH